MSLPANWIDRIFSKMTVTYGSSWLRMWEGVDPEAVKANWALELAQFANDAGAIKHGLEHLPASRPPTVLEFRDLCKQGVIREVYQALPAPSVRDREKVDAIVDGLRRRFVGGKVAR